MFLLTFFGFLVLSAKFSVQNEDTLVLVHVIVRHGDRTPDPNLTFPNDPYKQETYYPYGKGQLTQNGINSCYKFGKYLRKRYDKFLGKIFEPKFLEATASLYRRTRMALQSILAGLFPPAQPYVIDKDINWQPIPFDYLEYNDKLLAVHRGYKQIGWIEKDFATATPESLKFYKYVSEHSGWNVTTLTQMGYIADTIHTQIQLGLKQPKWIRKIWPEPLRSAIIDYWFAICYDENRRAYAGGNLINKILEDTIRKIDGRDEDKKLVIYSAHDITIVGVLGNLKIFNNEHVNYVASVIIEIHRIEGFYYAKILYRNYEEDEPMALAIPGCSELCPLKKFLKLARIAMPKDS